MAAAAGSMQELRDQARQARHEAEMRLLGMTAVTGGADDLEKEAIAHMLRRSQWTIRHKLCNMRPQKFGPSPLESNEIRSA